MRYTLARLGLNSLEQIWQVARRYLSCNMRYLFAIDLSILRLCGLMTRINH